MQQACFGGKRRWKCANSKQLPFLFELAKKEQLSTSLAKLLGGNNCVRNNSGQWSEFTFMFFAWWLFDVPRCFIVLGQMLPPSRQAAHTHTRTPSVNNELPHRPVCYPAVLTVWDVEKSCGAALLKWRFCGWRKVFPGRRCCSGPPLQCKWLMKLLDGRNNEVPAACWPCIPPLEAPEDHRSVPTLSPTLSNLI